MILRRLLLGCLLAFVAACDAVLPSPRQPQPTTSSDSLPPLEPISFDLLGHSKIVFERLSTIQREAGGLEAPGGIYVIDAAARRSYPLVDYRRVDGAEPALSPDGKTVAFTAYANDFTCCGRQLYVVNINGTSLHRIGAHSDGETFSPTWWPDGSRLLTRVINGSTTSFYIQAPTATASPSLIARIEASGDSAWSFGGQASVANGRMLLHASVLAQSPPAVDWSGFITMRDDGTALTRFYDAPSLESPIFAPTWSPDGRRIAFLAGYLNAFDKWTTIVEIMNADGSDVQQLASVPSVGTDADTYVGSVNAFSLCWLSTGSSIVFSAPVQQGLWHLFIISATTPGKPYMLTSDLGAQDTSVSCAD